MNPFAWLKRLRARYTVAQRFKTGHFVLRGSSGETLASGPVKGRMFSFDLLSTRVRRSGIVRKLELWNVNGKLALELSPKPFAVSKRHAFAGKRMAFP